MGGMGVFLRVAIGMVHPVQNGISTGIQKRRALGNKSETIKESLPKLIHFKHLMRGIPVQEKGLRE